MSNTLWIHHARPRSSWYRLLEEERQTLLARWASLDSGAIDDGATRVGTYAVRGQSDYATVEVWQFDAPESVHAFWERRVAADYAVWFAFANQIGIGEPG